VPTPTILGAPINSRLGLPHLSAQSAILDTENAVRCLGTPVQPVFSRASVAYRADGSQVATGVPRLERGRWHNVVPATIANFSAAPVSGVAGGWSRFDQNADVTPFVTYSVVADADGPAGLAQRIVLAAPSGLTVQRYSTLWPTAGYSAIAGEVWSVAFRTRRPTLSSGLAVGYRIDQYNGGSYLGTDVTTVLTPSSEWAWVVKENVTLRAGTTSIKPVVQLAGIDNGSTAEVLVDAVVLIRHSAAPRFFLPGGYGERGAVTVEEGTTNYIPNDGEGETHPWGGDGVPTFVQSTAYARIGAKSVRVTPGTIRNAYIVGTNITAGGSSTTWKFSVFIRRADGAAVSGIAAYMYSGDTYTAVFDSITLDRDGWYKAVKTRTLGSAGAISLVGVTSLDSATDWYLDGWQLEPKSYATSFTVGTRAAESLTLDVRGLLRAEEGAISGWWYEDGQTSGSHHLFDTDAGDRVTVYRTGANWTAAIGSTTFQFAKPAVGWHHIALRYRGIVFDVVVDGVVKGSATLPKPIVNVGPKLYVGTNYLGANFWNAPVQQPRLFTRWPSDAEIADLVRYSPLIGPA
jgi:hypothetical protein